MCGPFKKWAWNPISSLDPLICERHQLYFIFCICPTKYCNKLCAYFMNFMKTLYEYNIFYLNSFFFFLLLSLLCLLSLFLLLQFPHLVYGAVASSAPVKAKLDFSAYSNVNWHWAVDSIFYYYWYQTFPSANLAPNNSLASFHLNLRITQKNIFHCYWSLLETVTSV